MKTISGWFNTKFGWFFTNGNKPQYGQEQSYEEDLKTIAEALHHANELNLAPEIVTQALRYMKENPSLSITEAMTLGYFEYVK
jgi:hypothetical protein